MSVALVKEMFERMVLSKDPSAIARYYSPEFELFSNGKRQDYEEFAAGHERVYATEIIYRVEYDEEAWVESEDRVAGRVWVSTRMPDGPETRMEVILIARFKEGRIDRIWETTWPNWQNLQEMESYEQVD